MTFYDQERLTQLGKLIETFDDKSVIIVVGVANPEEEQIDFNFVSKMPVEVTFEALEGFVRFALQEYLTQDIGKSHLKLIEE